jgi:hypothetical protein
VLLMNDSTLQRIRQMDWERPGFPGEHWLAFGAGVAVWLGTRRHPSAMVRLLGSIAGTVLVARAATGREVPETLARWLPYARDPRNAPVSMAR